MKLRKRTKGVLLCVAATILLSPDNLLVVLINETETSVVTAFWKYLFASLAQWFVTIVILGGLREAADHLRQAGWYVLLGGLTQGAMSLCLVSAFMNTTSVKALVLFSMHVVWAALGGALWLGDKLPPRTVWMVVIGACSALAMFCERKEDGQEAGGDNELFGNLLALCAGAGFAFNLLLSRHLSYFRPGVSMLPTSAVGMTLAALGAFAFAAGSVPISQPRTAVPLMFLDGGVLVSLSMMGYAIGPQYLTAAEVTLICLLEPTLGPIFCYFGAGQVPSVVSVCSGCVLIVSLVAHEVVGMRHPRPPTPAGTPHMMGREVSEPLLLSR